MKTYFRNALGLALIVATAASMPACNEFLAVDNPGALETDAIDPERDARLLSQSVYQSFVSGIGEVAVYVAWFTNHARVGDTFPTRNVIGQRNIPNTNAHTRTFWNTLHRSIQFARTTVKSTEAAGPTVDIARAWFVSAYAILMQAELFCEGTIAENTTTPRGLMTTVALLDSAILDFLKVQSVVAAVTPATTELTNLSMAAQVGIARAHLQAGRAALASTAAGSVPAAFVYSLIHIDNSTQRSLGNQVWAFSEARISLVVGPEFRAMADAGDPRIAYITENRLAQDGVLPFTRQNKFKGWGDSERFASGLEAAYIKVEADQNAAAMLTFINGRRAVGTQTAITATDIPSLMTELMLQKSRDFWLEGRGIADFRRNPTYFPFILQPGPNYYKPSLGPVGSDTCWPVPDTELNNNCVLQGKC